MKDFDVNIDFRKWISRAYALYSQFLSDSLRRLFVAIFICFFISETIAAKERYQPKNVSVAADNFLARTDQPVINVEFIVAHTVNTVFHALREGREPSGTLINDGSNAGSVVINPGTDVNGLVIINDNEGDSIVINK